MERAHKMKKWRRDQRDENGPTRQQQLGKRHRRNRSLVQDYCKQQRLDELQPFLDKRDDLLIRQEELLADRGRSKRI